MPLDYARLMALPPMEAHREFTWKDTILYALGVGAGSEAPTDPGELQFVYEEGLKALPTMAVILAAPGLWQADPQYGITWRQMLHADQSLVVHRPLPVQGRVRGVSSIDGIYDKGAAKGALMYETRRIYCEVSGELLATSRQGIFLRADGGFGGNSEGAPAAHATPERAPDLTLEAGTRPDQALLYRLSGDYNPLHISPKMAALAGFKAPILHGLATYGVAGRLFVKHLCGNEPARLKRLDLRFSSPVYPGETLTFDIWREAAGVAFAARVVERGVSVLRHGYAEIA